MPSLLKRAKDIELKLHALVAEVRELKDELRQMEEENARLRTELAAVYREGCSGAKSSGEAEVKYRGFINLLDLYDQDYHIATCTSVAGEWANTSSAWLLERNGA